MSRRGERSSSDGDTAVLAVPAPGSGAQRPRDPAGRRRRSVWRRIWLTLVVLIAIVVAIPAFIAFRVWYVARQDSTPKSDAIIVLGTAQYDGRPSPVLEWRLIHARNLYRKGVAPAIVTVGGNQPGDRFTEAGSGKEWLAEHGVPRENIVAVSEGNDTLQSLKAVGREFKRRQWHTGVLVTDPWHALRSRTMARDAGIDAETSPTRSGPIVQTRDTQMHYIVRETGAYLYYLGIGRFRGEE